MALATLLISGHAMSYDEFEGNILHERCKKGDTIGHRRMDILLGKEDEMYQALKMESDPKQIKAYLEAIIALDKKGIVLAEGTDRFCALTNPPANK